MALQPQGVVRNDEPEQSAYEENIQEPLHSHIRLTGDHAEYPEESAERLLMAYAELHTAGNYTGAEFLAETLIEKIPNHPHGHYNLACSLARQNKIKAAVDALEDAVRCGWRAVQHTRADPDLEPLHAEPAFVALLREMDERHRNEAVVVQPLRLESPDDIAGELDLLVPDLLARYQQPGVVIAYINNGELVWVRSFGRHSSISDAPIDASAALTLGRPFELLALIAAGQQSQTGHLDFGQLLREADRINLRDSSDVDQPDLNQPYLPGNAARLASQNRSGAALATSKGTGPTAFDFAGHNTIAGTLELIMLGVELTSEQAFARYCRTAILDPLEIDAQAMSLVYARRPGSNATTLQRPSMIGHSILGTPVESPAEPGSRQVLSLTVEEMAQLLCSTMAGQFTTDEAVPLRELMRDSATAPLGLGLSIQRCPSGDGSTPAGFQIAELRLGQGMAARWFPEAGRGIVVYFNSENGPDVAERIINHALGGG